MTGSRTAVRVADLEAENARLREFASSFHVAVSEGRFCDDVTLHLERPHSLSLRIQNDSRKSRLFADLEERRRAALKGKNDE